MVRTQIHAGIIHTQTWLKDKQKQECLQFILKMQFCANRFYFTTKKKLNIILNYLIVIKSDKICSYFIHVGGLSD